MSLERSGERQRLILRTNDVAQTPPSEYPAAGRPRRLRNGASPAYTQVVNIEGSHVGLQGTRKNSIANNSRVEHRLSKRGESRRKFSRKALIFGLTTAVAAPFIGWGVKSAFFSGGEEPVTALSLSAFDSSALSLKDFAKRTGNSEQQIETGNAIASDARKLVDAIHAACGWQVTNDNALNLNRLPLTIPHRDRVVSLLEDSATQKWDDGSRGPLQCVGFARAVSAEVSDEFPPHNAQDYRGDLIQIPGWKWHSVKEGTTMIPGDIPTWNRTNSPLYPDAGPNNGHIGVVVASSANRGPFVLAEANGDNGSVDLFTYRHYDPYLVGQWNFNLQGWWRKK